MNAPGGVRRAGSRDLEAATALWLKLGEHHAAIDPAFAQRRDPVAHEAALEIARTLLADPDAALFLWDEEGRSLGLCVVRMGRAPEVAVERERAEISDLWVEPAARRAGVGRTLVEAALDWIRERDVPRVTVRVLRANQDGQAFWRALGWGDFLDVLQRRL
jgi:GNAT superfamily N-acetyltransferase